MGDDQMAYERMPDKSIIPTFADIQQYTGERRKLWLEFARRMVEICPMQTICDNKYPCNDGGWLSYRVLTDDNLDDVLKILASKLNK